VEITKDGRLDVAYVRLRRGRVVRTVEIRAGVLLDLDKNGEVLGIEVLSMSKLAPALLSVNGKRKKKTA